MLVLLSTIFIKSKLKTFTASLLRFKFKQSNYSGIIFADLVII